MLSLTHVCNRMIFVRARGKNCNVVIWRETSMWCTNDSQHFEFRMQHGGDIFMPMCPLSAYYMHTPTLIVVSCHRFSFTPSNQFLLLWLQVHVLVIYFNWSNLLFFFELDLLLDWFISTFGEYRNRYKIDITFEAFGCADSDLYFFWTRIARYERNWQRRPTLTAPYKDDGAIIATKRVICDDSENENLFFSSFRSHRSEETTI